MDRGLIDAFEIKFKSAFRNLKSAILLCALLLALSVPADGQQAAKVTRIGFMGNSPTPEQVRIEVFRQKLRELGWVEGQNIIIEYRWANGRFDLLPELAAELVKLKVEVIFAPASVYVEAARRATATIPIVFAVHGDPIGAGHVASLARPGGNITGLAQMQTELNAKGLELLKEAVPGLRMCCRPLESGDTLA
jgi:putative ABC transport system substrate-binding protein